MNLSGGPLGFARRPLSAVPRWYEWYAVTLRPRVIGWMHGTRIRFYFTEKDLLSGLDEPSSELNDIGRRGGFDYRQLAKAAASGNAAACRKFFGLDTDGAAAELHCHAVAAAVHLMADES
jgi:hypothetical protein